MLETIHPQKLYASMHGSKGRRMDLAGRRSLQLTYVCRR